MFDSLYIAWKYISYNRIKTVVLIACITLITFLPFSLQLLLDESERQFAADQGREFFASIGELRAWSQGTANSR